MLFGEVLKNKTKENADNTLKSYLLTRAKERTKLPKPTN